MIRQRWWLALALAVSVAAGGLLGWRGAQWRQAYYAERTGGLVYDLDMAHRHLVRAAAAESDQVKLDAMATAFGFLVSAQAEAEPLLERMAPSRRGRPVYMPKHYVPLLIQYARSLSPDMPQAALQRRIDLVGGLTAAFKEGLSDQRVAPGLHPAVDMDRLLGSLERFFDSFPPGEEPQVPLRFADEPNPYTLTARRSGSDVVIRLDWGRTYRLFPYDLAHPLLLVRAGDGVTVTSDVGDQPRMGADPLPPYTVRASDADLHDLVAESLPADWTPGSYTVIRVPEGLPQRLTLRLPEGAGASLLFLDPLTGGQAVAIPVE